MTTWTDVDPELRKRAVRFLRSRLSLEDQDALRRELADGWAAESWTERYSGWGGEIRGLLRNHVADDDELPDGGWVEFWTAAVEEAVSSRGQSA